MTGERVSIFEAGKSPVILVAPHGHPADDVNTTVIAQHVAEVIKGYAVINNGWNRGNVVDCLNDKADCNNFSHMVEVVRDEFLEPILRFRNRILRKYQEAFIFFIHGMANDIRQKTGEKNLEVIIGYGAGNPPSYSCDVWRKDLFIFLLKNAGLTTWEGKAGGMMSGWTRNNMNQLFRKHIFDPRVHSMQIEIVRDLRSDESISILTAEYLGAAIQDLIQYNSWSKPLDFEIKQY